MLAVVTCECLELLLAVFARFKLSLLALQELFVGDRVSLAVESQLNQLSGELLVLQIKEVRVADLVV